MQKGKIGIDTENIFPVIKKFLYSDHEIFLRELVSNAVDATQKLKTLSRSGECKGELGDLSVRVSIDQAAGTLTISDRGIGMTADEIDRYINQIAFSGAGEFLEKYKDDAAAIIGHFGLGFYSAFMVADRVDIVTRSYRPEAEAVKWTCDGSPSFEITPAERAERGTDIVLHISEDCKEFLEKTKIAELLNKYCRFLPVPIVFGKKTEWKDGKEVDTEEDNQVNETEPLWLRKPADLKDEDYRAFYHKLYPASDDPMFWIHLNVDYPFHLTGVLFFPRIKSNLDVRRNSIQLYCNQVFVTDHVENIVPEFLTLLHGVIDSPDIPLNVSRSYLQSDANVKKISSYIMKKVSDRLASICKNDRADFEKKWDDLKLFMHYGMLSEQDFYDKAKDYALLKDVDGKYFTYKEYQELVKGEQTDKDDNLICLYASDANAQYTAIQAAKNKGYSVLMLDGELDTALVQMLENKWEKTRFTRVDGDVIDRLIRRKDEENGKPADDVRSQRACKAFSMAMPKVEKADFHVEAAHMGQEGAPVVITQSEYMRRMKEMSRFQQGMDFYATMPEYYNVVLNADHKLLQGVMADMDNAVKEKLDGLDTQIAELNTRRSELDKKIDEADKDHKDQAAEDERKQVNDDLEAREKEKDEVCKTYAPTNPVIAQLIDLALLQNGLLKGEALARFVERSVKFIG